MIGSYIALFFTVVLLVTTAYFLMGGLPLLILAHDTPMDGRFVRRFFEIYYAAALFGASGAALGYVLWNKAVPAAGVGCIALLVLWLKRFVLSAMLRLSVSIEAKEPGSIADFRKMHATALLINLAQLVLIVLGLLQL
jgi:hypothetical protein